MRRPGVGDDVASEPGVSVSSLRRDVTFEGIDFVTDF